MQCVRQVAGNWFLNSVCMCVCVFSRQGNKRLREAVRALPNKETRRVGGKKKITRQSDQV